jgi:hypothetical protein
MASTTLPKEAVAGANGTERDGSAEACGSTAGWRTAGGWCCCGGAKSTVSVSSRNTRPFDTRTREEYAARVRVSKGRVLREVSAVAFADPADAFDPDPNGGPLLARPLHKIPAATRRAIQSVKVKRRRIAGNGSEVYEVEEVEYKFASKLDALDKLCKRLGFYTDEANAPKDGKAVIILDDNGRDATQS